MNKMNLLVKLLDELYGFEDRVGNSTIRVIDHKYDKQNNYYSTVLEYRTRRKGQIVSNRLKENSLLKSLLG